MILITGGTGFIGSHLVEAVCARGEPLRCLIRRDSSKRHPFALPAEAEIVFGDLVSGEGLSDALEGVGTVIHLAGVTKALSTSEFYSGNAGATENLARAVAGRAVRFVYVSSLAAIGPSTDGTPVSEDAEPHPITHYGRSKLEGERIARALVPDAVIVRPAVVYGPRDRDVLELVRPISKGFALEISGGERWFQAIYVKDLADGVAGSGMRPSSRRPRVLSCPRESGFVERAEVRGGSHHAEASASPTDSFAACVRRGRLRGNLLPPYRETGDHLTREGERSAMPPLDLRDAPRGARTGLRSADASGPWTRPNACLVQGGGLAEVLNSDGRFWATDKLILAYLAGTGALVAVYWNRLPEAPEMLALHVGAAIAIVLASTARRSRGLVLPELVSASAGGLLL